MSGFEITLSHRGFTTEVTCKGELSEQALERIKEAVDIGLRRGSTSVIVDADCVGVRGTSLDAPATIHLDPPDAGDGAATVAPGAAYYLG